MTVTSLALWLALASHALEGGPDDADINLAPRMTSSPCEVWLSSAADVSFDELARRVAHELRGASTIVLREWTASSQPGATGWWIRVAETREQWQIAYLGPDGKVELEALPVLDPSTLAADIAGEVALVALSSCSAGSDLAAASTITPVSTGLRPAPFVPAPSPASGKVLLGAALGLGTVGLVASAVGFGLSFHYYRRFKANVDDCMLDNYAGSNGNFAFDEVYAGCRSKHQRTMRMHWYMSGIGTAGTVMFGTGLVLAIPAVLELRRARGARVDMRVLAWTGSRGAGVGLSGRF